MATKKRKTARKKRTGKKLVTKGKKKSVSKKKNVSKKKRALKKKASKVVARGRRRTKEEVVNRVNDPTAFDVPGRFEDAIWHATIFGHMLHPHAPVIGRSRVLRECST